MTEYIINWTDSLIRKHAFNLTYHIMGDGSGDNVWKNTFLRLIERTLLVRELPEMSPETLGGIICSFNEKEVTVEISNFRPCDKSLREAVALLLAHTIRHRLEESNSSERGSDSGEMPTRN